MPQRTIRANAHIGRQPEGSPITANAKPVMCIRLKWAKMRNSSVLPWGGTTPLVAKTGTAPIRSQNIPWKRRNRAEAFDDVPGGKDGPRISKTTSVDIHCADSLAKVAKEFQNEEKRDTSVTQGGSMSFVETLKSVSKNKYNLGKLYMSTGDVERARQCFQEALKARKELYGDGHERVTESEEKLAQIAEHLQKLSSARKHLSGTSRSLPPMKDGCSRNADSAVKPSALRDCSLQFASVSNSLPSSLSTSISKDGGFSKDGGGCGGESDLMFAGGLDRVFAFAKPARGRDVSTASSLPSVKEEEEACYQIDED